VEIIPNDQHSNCVRFLFLFNIINLCLLSESHKQSTRSRCHTKKKKRKNTNHRKQQKETVKRQGVIVLEFM
jgi:hypothetical protein